MSNSTGPRQHVSKSTNSSPSSCPKQVAQMRLTVQELFAGGESADFGTQATQCVAEEFPVGARKPWGLLSVGDQPLCFGDSVGEMRCAHLDLAQAGMEPDKCLRVLGRRDV